jgi:hypothetical protein
MAIIKCLPENVPRLPAVRKPRLRYRVIRWPQPGRYLVSCR